MMSLKIFKIIFFCFILLFIFYNFITKYTFINRKKYEVIQSLSKHINTNSSIKNTTVITVYFELDRSKHSKEKYQNWLKNMLNSVEKAPLVIFTDRNSVYSINQTRSTQLSNTVIYVYESIWDVLKELGRKRKINYVENYLNIQNSLDPEKNIHNPSLYAIWNLKSYFVQKVVELNPFKSSFFIYTDAGAWRKNSIPQWPDNQFINELKQKLNDCILLGQISRNYDPKTYISYSSVIQGGFFAGSARAIKMFYTEFWRIHDKLFRENKFVGKEQTIMKILSFDSNKICNVRLKSWEAKCKVNYDPWFFYQIYFSNNFQCVNERFSLLSF